MFINDNLMKNKCAKKLLTHCLVIAIKNLGQIFYSKDQSINQQVFKK